ncbi:YkgJ family cysteine cluster protein [Methanolobus sp.]|jgi:Fe-S-cluster containining protein|uniref:YkgJ family cysteine cluster protein n=1 Tax=Methanolobus sp. TaxID=1874737 RepID=UPI002589638F|nr:YkgJ family cysteine cluster protein [Methanolobus sp.]
MSAKIRLKDTIIYQIATNILSHYECPSDCPAHCCKAKTIEMDAIDLKELSNVSKAKTEDLDFRVTNSTTYYSLKNPCPFLSESGKCGAYEYRPTICRIYPFNTSPEPGMFTIDPCKMGIIILCDLYKHMMEIEKESVPGHVYIALKECSDIFERNKGIAYNVTGFGFSIEYLKIFSDYLNSK